MIYLYTQLTTITNDNISHNAVSDSTLMRNFSLQSKSRHCETLIYYTIHSFELITDLGY